MLIFTYNTHIRQVSLRSGFSDTWQTWMWLTNLTNTLTNRNVLDKEINRNTRGNLHLVRVWICFKTYNILCVDCDPGIHQLTRPGLPNKEIHTCSTTWHSFYKQWLPKVGLGSGMTKYICIWLWNEIIHPCPDIQQNWYLYEEMKDYFYPAENMGYNQ